MATPYPSLFYEGGIVSPWVGKSQCSQRLLNPALCNIVGENNSIKLLIKCDCSAGFHCTSPKHDEDEARIHMLMCMMQTLCSLRIVNQSLTSPNTVVVRLDGNNAVIIASMENIQQYLNKKRIHDHQVSIMLLYTSL